MSRRVHFTLFCNVLLLGLAILAPSCAPVSEPIVHPRAKRKLYDWNDNGGPGKVTVRISLTDQIAEVRRGDQEIGWCYVATGKEGHATRPGTYPITEKIVDKHSNIYGWMEDEDGNVTNGDAKSSDPVPKGMRYVAAPMPYWMRLTSYGIGMHGGIIPQPGEPASHGCIRMPKAVVPRIFDVVSVGTPVVITNAPSSRGLSSEPEPREQWTGSHSSGDPVRTSRSTSERPRPPRNNGMSAESVTYRDGMPVY